MFSKAYVLAIAIALSASVSAQSIPVWGQCGGQGWTGGSTCATGSTCVYQSQWYSQCLPGTPSATSTNVSRTSTAVVTRTSSVVPTTSSVAPSSTTSARDPAATIPAGVFTQISDFGPNPNNIAMYVYKPVGVIAKPALLVASHWCTGNAQAYYSGTQYKALADTKKSYIILYGTASASGGCWDVASNGTLTHNGGGDSLGIASAVRYAIANWNVDTSKVFATGTSSGGMMTNVLLGAYPDLFKAGASFAGVGYGCFAGPNAWNSQCASGQLIKTPEEWGNQVRAAYPGYTGPRPKVQLWHGTNDDVVYYQNFLEAIKQWTNVLGVSLTSTLTDTPLPGYTKTVYGAGLVEAYSVASGPHNIPTRENDVLAFFGL